MFLTFSSSAYRGAVHPLAELIFIHGSPLNHTLNMTKQKLVSRDFSQTEAHNVSEANGFIIYLL